MPTKRCFNCGKFTNGEFEDPEGNIICEKCENLLAECSQCGEKFWRSDLYEDPNGKLNCQECFDEHCFFCDKCGSAEWNDDRTSAPDGDSYCQQCFDEHCSFCDDCERVIWSENSFNVNDRTICESCFNEHYGTCEACGVNLHRDQLFSNDNGYDYCEGCYESDDDKIHIESREANEDDIDNVVYLLLNSLKRKNPFNPRDSFLREIAEKIGEVENPVYLFGLRDRPDYEISVTPALYERIKHCIMDFMGQEYLAIWSSVAPVIVRDCKNRYAIGFSKNLRENYQEWICEFIQDITNPVGQLSLIK